MADEVKMGTQYVREIAASFRKAAAAGKFPEIDARLVALAGDMETQAGKLYFKTQKGTEEMEALAKRLQGFEDKLAASDQAGAQALCNPVITEIEKTLEVVKNMKVRMT